MPIVSIGKTCERLGCTRPLWKDSLCNPCWRLARLFGKDPAVLVQEPLIGKNGIALPWKEWEEKAEASGKSLADQIGETD
jgi:hypothetical protein